MDVTAHVTRSHPAWSGSATDLLELADLIHYHCQLTPARVPAGVPGTAERGIRVRARAEWLPRPGWLSPIPAWQPDRTATGSPVEVVAACAADPPSDLTLSAERGFGADAAIRISASHLGVRLTVDGEPGWANAAGAALDHALRSRVPSWALLRRLPIGYAAALPLFAALAVVSVRLPAVGATAGLPAPARAAVGVLSGVLMFAALGLLPIALLRVLPALELAPPGGPSRGARRARQVAAGYLGALAGLIALAVAL